MGVYREADFSPGKVDADAAILDAALAELRRAGAQTFVVDPVRLLSEPVPEADLVLAMCQGGEALSRLATVEKAGTVTINSALAIRNCYRDLLGAGLARAGIPVPEGTLVETNPPLNLRPLRALDLSAPMYVKRGDLHALAPSDVRRVDGLEQLEATLLRFARRGVTHAYVQQEVVGDLVKFYGVGGGQYFATLPQGEFQLSDALKLGLTQAANDSAAALGLDVWGGDAVVSGDRFLIIDFNDWPSFGDVRDDAARAIARHTLRLMHRHEASRGNVTM
jgi:glutathione synthase/RimK-type ligase-like ATP-grasp enzyme